MKHAFTALALLASSGCLSLEEPEVEAIALRSDPGDPTCPIWGCGANSATVGDGLIFDELDRTGNEANAGGLRIVSANAADGSQAFLYVYRHWLWVGTYDGRWFSGQGLVNTVFAVNNPLKGTYEVKITAVYEQTLQYWAGAPEYVPFYEMKTRRKGALKFDEYACRSPLTEDPMWSNAAHAAVIFQGDRYDAKYKKARDVGDSDPWFNIACAATAPAKMHLMRHTRAGSTGPGVIYSSSDYERTALLKMFTADYCGTGHTFTIDGTPLAYQDSNHWKMTMEDRSQDEALWTASGATCLHKPRWVDDLNMVYAACGRVIPDCSVPVPGWESSAHVFSALR